MPDSSSQDPHENQTDDSVDLSQLKSFSFGTQWTEASKAASSQGKPRFNRSGGKGGERRDRRGDGGPPARKDRRPQRPVRAEGGAEAPPAESRFAGNRRSGGRHEGHRPTFHPYESPVFDVCFYPEDNCFSAIIKAMRANHMTYELFHVAKLFMEKPDRFIASVTRKAEKGQKPEKVTICVADNMPFATEEEAIAHAMAHHADRYFTTEEVEVDPPSGNFPFVNRCPFTKELLGPPNYHKYEETLRKHHRTRLPHMAFEKLQGAIETVREEEAVNAWLESQKKQTRYTVKEPEEGEEAKSFDSFEAALGYVRSELKSKVLKQVNYARVGGAVLEQFKDSEAFKAMDGERQRQQRFPLDTANAIRGRMRREKFSIYKRGAKGVTYVCATKRNFRAPGQVMSPDLDRIIRFLEAHPSLKAKEMPGQYEEWLKTEAPDQGFDEKKLARDLHWLIADGYVSHFEDDTLYPQPVLETGASARADKPKTEDAKPSERLPAREPKEQEQEQEQEKEETAEVAAAAGEASTALEQPDAASSDSEAAPADTAATAPSPASEPAVSQEATKVSETPELEAAAEASTPEPEATPEASATSGEDSPASPAPQPPAAAEATESPDVMETPSKPDAKASSELPQSEEAKDEAKPEAKPESPPPEAEESPVAPEEAEKRQP